MRGARTLSWMVAIGHFMPFASCPRCVPRPLRNGLADTARVAGRLHFAAGFVPQQHLLVAVLTLQRLELMTAGLQLGELFGAESLRLVLDQVGQELVVIARH